jgi:nucleoside-diphosphate-sugar epimerase
VTHLRSDLLDRGHLTEIFARVAPDAVVHLAARTDLDERRDLSGYAANIAGVENLIAAVSSCRSIRRAIYTSSQLVCRIGYVPRSDVDYRPTTLYGESKVRTEQIVRASDGGGVEWCLVRPTLVWGPGMGSHYRRFFRMVAAGRYVHVGHRPLHKSLGYVGNVVHQYETLLSADAAKMSRRTLYLADYEPVSQRAWADSFQRLLGAPKIRTVPESLATLAARAGDLLNALGWRRFPFNSFRLGNVLTEYVYDLTPARELCGPLPFTTEDGVAATVQWLRDEGIVGH